MVVLLTNNNEVACLSCWQLLPRNYRIHRHCFTGNWRDGQHWLHKFPSSYIGVTPLVTLHNARAAAVRDFVQHVPLDRLLLETDSPYFIPSEVSVPLDCGRVVLVYFCMQFGSELPVEIPYTK